MKFWQKIVLIGYSLGIVASSLSAAPEIMPPDNKAATAFAIIIDRATYTVAESGVQSYRQALENDGLAVYTVVDEWSAPETVRDIVRDLASRQPPLEGIVLIGNIPIAMVRDAQHLTSAFKINQERYDWIDSSVPTDRFYDDFDLEFTYLQQDSANPLLFYYSLNSDSPQKVGKDIYSGRIKPPVGDQPAAEVIRDYLLKVARVKAEANQLDNMLAFAGHGYHSESVIAWSDEQLALREAFPELYSPPGRLTYLYHTISNDLKNTVLRELQVPELDMILFHAHGSEDSQLLIGYPTSSAIANNVEAVKLFVRSKLRQAQRRGQSVEETKAGFIERYGIPEDWFAGAFEDSVKAADSLYAATLDIYIDDIRQLSPQAEVIIFDECFNGAFMLDTYVAGEYVFGAGSTVVGIANSVNIKQDVWTDEFLGLLGEGIRIGQMHRNWDFLESHIIGDPTFHYTSPIDLNPKLAGDNQKVGFWRKLLNGKSVPLQVLAIHHLTQMNGWKSPAEMVQLYRSSTSYNIRMASLLALAELNGPEFRTILVEACHDPYELIRRMTVMWMGEIGDEKYIPVLAESIVHDQARRVNFQAKNAIQSIDAAQAIVAVDSVLANTAGGGYERVIALDYQQSWERTQSWLNDDLLKVLPDTSQTLKKRIGKVRTFRSYKFHSALPFLMEIVQDQEQDATLRTALLEALGWYHFSPYREEIIASCEAVLKAPGEPETVLKEAEKTVNRLRFGVNNPLTP